MVEDRELKHRVVGNHAIITTTESYHNVMRHAGDTLLICKASVFLQPAVHAAYATGSWNVPEVLESSTEVL